ncbi:hypothetical protein [Pseudooceanicola sp. LIPI14-2-Ac024]|uniref:hypothetical protein n=1 Tax=Pseudooceanicola sp. LIPI14-2-Ac024 TaxID=3344875 RepID=UPI0035CF8F4E
MVGLTRLAAACGALGMIAACATPPTGVGPEMVEAYDRAVASVGCEMVNEPQYNAVEFQTGLTREQTIEMGQYRMAAGAAEPIEGGGVRLITGPCAA